MDEERIHKRIDEVGHELADLRVDVGRHDEQIDAIVGLGKDMRNSIKTLCSTVQEHSFIVSSIKRTTTKIIAIVGATVAVIELITNLL